MPFVADASTVGIPNFGIIHIDPDQTAKAFQTYLDTASKLTGVALDDINRTVISLPPDPQRTNLVELTGLGMKLFDAVVWLTAGRPTSHPLRADPGKTKESIPSQHQIARAVFYCYFMLVTQARYPGRLGSTVQAKIPNFLNTIMGMSEEQGVYVDRICSFEPQKFDPKWAQYVKFSGFGQEVLSRFGLGVAGYRMFGPFSLYQPKPGVDASLQNAITFARTVATAPSSWSVHPLTRDPNILTSRGNLNKNLGNLILEVFTTEDIDEMVAAKILFKKPEKEPTHRQYKLWAPQDDITGLSKIF